MKQSIENLKNEVKRHGTNPQDLFRMGQDLLARGDFKSARLKFRLALLYNPRIASKVALCYENILEEESGNINARLSLADLHLYLGEVEAATGELEEILDIAPDRVDVYNMLGKLYIKQGDVDGAINVIEIAFSSGLKDTSLVEMLAGAYMEKGRIDDAISLYVGLLDISPNNINYLRVLGELYARIEKFDAAAESFYSMLSNDVSNISEVVYKLEELKKKQPGIIRIKEALSDAYVKALKPAQAVSELHDVLAIDTGRLDGIITKLKQILDKYPGEPSALKELARAFTMKQSYSEAVDEYRKLMKYSDAYLDEAVAGFKDVLSRFPEQLHAHESLGDAYLAMGRIEEALLEYLEVMRLNNSAAKTFIEKCQKIAAENPNMVLVHQVLGRAYILAGDGNSAIKEAEFLIYLDKNSAPAYQIMGDAFMKMGSQQKARDSYIAAMKIEPFNIPVHSKYEEASASIIKADIELLKKKSDEDPWKLGTHLDIAKLYLVVQDFDRGIKELQVAVKDPAKAPFAYNLLGITFVELGRFDLAASQFERSLETMPKELSEISKTMRFNLGAALEAMGNVPGAITNYELVLAEDVEFAGLQGRTKNLASINPESQRNKMVTLVVEQFGGQGLIGMWGQDLRHGETSRESLSISFGQEHNNAGFEHFIKGRFKGAMEEFSLAVQLDPKFCAAINNLAVMYLREGQLEQADTRLRLALSIDPDYAVIHNNLGIYYYLKKDLDSAVSEFNKALQADPSLSAAYINLGDVMYLKGSAQDAISLWEKVKTNDPLTPMAARRLLYKTIKD